MNEYQQIDSIEAAMAYILKRILYAIPIIIVLISLVLYYVHDPVKANVLLASIPFFLLLLFLVNKGYLHTSLNILLIVVNLIVTWSCMVGNGIHDIGIIIYPINVLIASLMVTRLNLILFTAMTMGCMIFIVLGDLYGLYQPYPVYVGRWPDVFIMGSLLLMGLVITSSHASKLKQSIKDRIIEGERQIEVGIQIEKNIEEKQQLFREVHHRVKNHISFINSLVDMEAMNQPDIDMVAIRELQSKVVAIARVHDQLYHSDNFDRVQTKSYLDGIISQFAMNYQLAEISIDLKIDDFLMEVNRIIYLGISVHEIVSLLGKFNTSLEHIEFILTNEDGARQLSVILEHTSGLKISDHQEKIKFLNFLSLKLNGKLELIEGKEKSFIEIEF
jgi:two-component sensor histidine kinase